MNILKKGVVWITGLSASGKTTLSELLYLNLKQQDFNNVVLLDGESMREKYSIEYGYTVQGRSKSSMADIDIVRLNIESDLLTIIATISPQKEVRAKAREQLQNYSEVYLKCPVEECAHRDYKDHYRRAFLGELNDFVGVDQEYQLSDKPDIVINTQKNSIKRCSELLSSFVLEKYMFKGNESL